MTLTVEFNSNCDQVFDSEELRLDEFTIELERGNTENFSRSIEAFAERVKGGFYLLEGELFEYLEAAKNIFESEGEQWKSEYGRLKGILNEFSQRVLPKSIPEKGVLGKLKDFFFSSDIEEKLMYRAAPVRDRLAQFSIALGTDKKKAKALERSAAQQCLEDERAERGIPEWEKAIWQAIFAYLQVSGPVLQGASRDSLEKVYRKALGKQKIHSQRSEKGEAFIGKILVEKLDAIRDMDDQCFQRFIRRYPETGEILNRFRSQNDPVSESAINKARTEFRATQTAPLVLQPGKWWEAFTGVRPAVKHAETVQNRASDLTPLQRNLYELQTRVTLQNTNQAPDDRLNEPCYALQTLEEQLKSSMQAVRPQLQPSQETLSQYGPKHHNLVKMDWVTKALGVDDLIIPAPQGISSEQVRRFLPEKVFTHWEKLRELKQKDDGQVAFFSQPEPQRLLQEIDQEIEEAFSADKAWNELSLTQEAKKWFEEMGRASHFLMVRSTGAEDSSKVANAGGNESCAYVPATPKDLCMAIGRVVRSYFSRNSLQIRLSGGANPFEEDLKLAVTTQQLIGEPVGGATDPTDIPVSFVLFTHEPLYVAGENFRAMRLSATYGHGEAVVKNMGIASDSVLILHSEAQPDQLYYLYNNQNKPTRLAPQLNEQGKVSLQPMANPEELQNRPALSHEQMEKLYRSGVLMEAFFEDHPTDIEGVVKGEEIYFVQARPVNRKPQLPTYLASVEGMIQKIDAESIVSGSASVVQVQSADEVIVATTLHEAEEIFGAKDAVSQGRVKLVVVSEPEPENSHSVVNFSGLMMPCLRVEDLSQVQTLLIPGKTLVACMQTATLSLWDGPPPVKEGFAVHPAKVAISLSTHLSPTHSPPVHPEIVSLLKQIRAGSLEALDRLEAHPQLLYLRAKNHYFANKNGPAAAEQRIAILNELEGQISRAFAEMRAVIPQEERVHALLHAKILETLLVGTTPGLGRYSLCDVEPLAKEIDEILAYQKEFPFPAKAADLLLAGKANPEALPQWRQFLIHVEKLFHEGQISSAEWQQFRTLMKTLQETGAWPLWLTFFQEQTQSSWFRSTRSLQLSRFKNILAQTSPAVMQQMRELMQSQKEVRQLQLQKERFADGKTLLEARQDLQKQIDLLSSSGWLDQVKSASPLVRSIAYKTMEQLVDLVDQSIKALKMSQVEGRVKIFKEMLLPFYTLMRTWVEKMVPQSAIPVHDLWPLGRYLEQMRTFLRNMPEGGTEQFLPSPGNSVSAAMLGAGTAFERHLPGSLEDMFTLIHQNALVALNALNQELLPPEQIHQSLLPEALKNAMARIERGEGNRTFQRMGIDIGSKELVIHYNVPLRNHSGHLELRCDLATGKMTFIAKLLGQARTRWPETAYWIRALEATGVVSADRPLFQNAQELSWSWTIEPETLEIALREYAAMAEYSLDLEENRFTEELESLYQRFENQPTIQRRLLAYFLSNRYNENSRMVALFYRFLAERANEEDLPLFIDVAKRFFQGERWELGLDLFRIILPKKIGVEVAIPLAIESLYKYGTVALFKVLLENGFGIEEAITGLRNEAENFYRQQELLAENHPDNLEVWGDDLELWGALIEKGQGIEEATKQAKQWLDTTRRPDFGLALYHLLAMNKRLDLLEGLSVCRKWMESFPSLTSRLLSHLIIQGAETEIGFEALQNRRLPLVDTLRLARALVLRGVVSDAYRSVLNEEKRGRWLAGEEDAVAGLLEAMTDQNMEPITCLREAIKLIHGHRRGADDRIIERAVHIIRKWVDRGQEYELAESALEKCRDLIAFSHGVELGAIFQLAKALVEKGHSFDLAFTLVQNKFLNLQRPTDDVLQAALSVAEALLERGEKVKELIQVAILSRTWMSDQSNKLFKLILDKGFGEDEAFLMILLEIAEKAILSSVPPLFRLAQYLGTQAVDVFLPVIIQYAAWRKARASQSGSAHK